MDHIKEEKYKRLVEKYYNAKVKDKRLKKGDLVLRNALLTMKEQDKGKLSPNWEGPYIIEEVISDDKFTLAKHDGKSLPRTWHANTLKKYYPIDAKELEDQLAQDQA